LAEKYAVRSLLSRGLTPRYSANPWAVKGARACPGALDLLSGEVCHVLRDGMDLPGIGLGDPAGVFRAAGYEPAGDEPSQIVGGNSFVLAVAFSQPLRAVVVMGMGTLASRAPAIEPVSSSSSARSACGKCGARATK
jgi:hypothetical protein